MLGDLGRGSKVWEVLDRAISVAIRRLSELTPVVLPTQRC
jgi:hypothetical protein